MNNYRKKAELLMDLGDKIIAEKKRKTAIVKRTAYSVSGICAAAVIGYGVWNNTGMRNAADMGELTSISESDSVVTTIADTPTASVTETVISAETTPFSAYGTAGSGMTVPTQKPSSVTTGPSGTTTVSAENSSPAKNELSAEEANEATPPTSALTTDNISAQTTTVSSDSYSPATSGKNLPSTSIAVTSIKATSLVDSTLSPTYVTSVTRENIVTAQTVALTTAVTELTAAPAHTIAPEITEVVTPITVSTAIKKTDSSSEVFTTVLTEATVDVTETLPTSTVTTEVPTTPADNIEKWEDKPIYERFNTYIYKVPFESSGLHIYEKYEFTGKTVDPKDIIVKFVNDITLYATEITDSGEIIEHSITVEHYYAGRTFEGGIHALKFPDDENYYEYIFIEKIPKDLIETTE